jgi:ABC-2 type transport system ATP-binding protein
MIEVEALTHHYGAHVALTDVSARIADREIVGFLGLNGAGKSTLLRILAGLVYPTGGTVRIDGVDVLEAPAAMRGQIGYLPDVPPLHPEMRVREFLSWCGRLRGRNAVDVASALPEVLAECGLADVADTIIAELSFGFRKRVGIAQAIIHRPRLVILDEPVSGLDPVQIVEMRALVRSLGKRATILVSSHILSEIEQTCDRLLVLHRGRLVAEGSEAELAAASGGHGRVRLTLRGALETIRRVLADRVRDGGIEVTSSEGEQHTLVVTLRTDLERADEAVAAGALPVAAARTAAAEEAVVRALVEAGIGVRRVVDAEPELESIFLALTRDSGDRMGEVTSPAQRNGGDT